MCKEVARHVAVWMHLLRSVLLWAGSVCVWGGVQCVL